MLREISLLNVWLLISMRRDCIEVISSTDSEVNIRYSRGYYCRNSIGHRATLSRAQRTVLVGRKRDVGGLKIILKFFRAQTCALYVPYFNFSALNYFAQTT